MMTLSRLLTPALALTLCIGCAGGISGDELELDEPTSAVTEETTTGSTDEPSVDEAQTGAPESTDPVESEDEIDVPSTGEDEPESTDGDFSQCGCGDSSQAITAEDTVSCIETLAESCVTGGGGMWQDFGSSYVTIVGWSDDTDECIFEFFVETEGAARGYTCSFDSERGFPGDSIAEEGWGDSDTLEAYDCTLIASCNQLSENDCLASFNTCVGAG